MFDKHSSDNVMIEVLISLTFNFFFFFNPKLSFNYTLLPLKIQGD